MWAFSTKQNSWVNIDTAQRISKDGKGGYLVTSIDGKTTPIDQEWYDKMMKWIDPDWWEKHPGGNKDSLNLEDAIKAIMKATGAKLENDKDKKEKDKED